ncbi:hypothetical protein [Roseovarius sp.]|uniref:hypothetical protein n=1 Tax=Roseovarius sp. TaxID=1486281 RepID=UPI002621DA41|nr:hypothetical protein [Roseovarius sp.]MDM8164868.1 hypothetical protein [Roseovarius sp.]
MPTRTLITALALCWLAGLAHAQAARFAGSWYCRYAMEPFSGQPLDLHYWEYRLYAQPDTSFTAEGFYENPVVGRVPVQMQGQYGPQPGYGNAEVVFLGTMYRAGSGQQPFQMPAIMSDPNTMYFQFRGNTHMTNITCSR